MKQQILIPAQNPIFSISSDKEFSDIALSVFRYQAAENSFYNKYLNALKVNPKNITDIKQIPFLPIEFFKSEKIVCGNPNIQQIFASSGTTGTAQSKHYVSDVSLYEKSYTKGFEHFYGHIEDYCVLALLPSYLEREGSSLVYMVNDLIQGSKNPLSGFYLHNYDDLINVLKQTASQKTILFGVTYALLDLAEKLSPHSIKFPNLIVMETGGMKGKRKEMVREELHSILCNGFGVNAIHSEYGMTELLSQAYSKGNGIFECPPWMKILIRDANDPFTILPENKTGGINVIDLANINSCSFIATQDLGKNLTTSTFEVLGRFDNSDIRGCNLLVG